MKTKPLRMTLKSILIVAIVGFVLIALIGCGIGYGPYRHGYDGRNQNNDTDYNRSGDGQYSNNSTAPKYNPGNSGYGSLMGYGSGRTGYCPW